jgi:hypothetical protein
MRKQAALALFAILALPVTATAKEQILCENAGKPNVVITLGAKRQFGRILNCISGDFIADLTPCAPDQGFGLSAGTGNAALVAVVDRWQDYATHLGGVTGNFVKGHEIYFSGGFNSPKSDTTINQNRASVGMPPIPGGDKIPDDEGYQELWSFSLSRLTGKAELKQKDKSNIAFSCRAAKAIL